MVSKNSKKVNCIESQQQYLYNSCKAVLTYTPKLVILKPKSKDPLLDGHDKLITSNNLTEIDEYIKKGRNIGMNTIDIGVLDLDEHDGKPYVIPSHINVDQPKTWQVISGGEGNGRHVYYKKPLNSNFGNVVEKFTEAGFENVDIRFNPNSYVLLPGCIHDKTGDMYKWREGYSPDDCELANTTEWCLSLLTPVGSTESPKIELDTSITEEYLREKIASLSPKYQDDIYNFNYAKGKRSEAFAALILALANAGFTAIEIRMVCEYFLKDKYNKPHDWDRCIHSAMKKIQDEESTQAIDLKLPMDKQYEQWLAKGLPYDSSQLFGTWYIITELMGHKITQNELDDRVYIDGNPITDATESKIRAGVKDAWKKKHKPTKETITDVIRIIADCNRFHPVKGYLNDLVWDGKEHIGKLWSYFEDAHEPFEGKSVLQIFFIRWLIGAIAKVYQQAQNPVLIFDGSQGLGKSLFCEWLASGIGKEDHFLSTSIDPDNKEHQRYIANKWIWESGEFGTVTRKKDIEATKHFLTLARTTFRVPFATHAVTKPCISSFIGTINNDRGFLNDPTGSRRFLPVTLTKIDWQGYTANIDVNQLWAQAMHLYQQDNDSWQLTPAEKALQAQLCEGYKVTGAIDDYLEKVCELDPSNDEWFASSTDIAKAMKLGGYDGNSNSLNKSISDALQLRGHNKIRQRVNGKYLRGFVGVKIEPEFDGQFKVVLKS